MSILLIIIFTILLLNVLNPLSAKGGEAHGLDFAKTVLGYKDWENLREWNKTLSAKDPLLFTIQVKDIISSAAAIAIDYSGTEGSQSNDFFILENYFQMVQFCRNKTDIPRIEDMPSLGFGIMHRNYCHSGFLVDRSSAEDSLKARLLESYQEKKFGIGKNRSLLSKEAQKKRFLNSPGRWKIGRTKILVPSVANAFDLNLKRRPQRELAIFIATIVYYTHLLGDYIVGAQGPLPEYRESIDRFQNDLHKVHCISFKNKIAIKNFFNGCSFDEKNEINAQKTIDKMGSVFPRIICSELRRRNSNTYHKLKENKRVAIKEILDREKISS